MLNYANILTFELLIFYICNHEKQYDNWTCFCNVIMYVCVIMDAIDTN